MKHNGVGISDMYSDKEYEEALKTNNTMKQYEYIDLADQPLKKGQHYFWAVRFLRHGKIDQYPSRNEMQCRADSRARVEWKGLLDERGNRLVAHDLTTQGFDVALVRTIGIL